MGPHGWTQQTRQGQRQPVSPLTAPGTSQRRPRSQELGPVPRSGGPGASGGSHRRVSRVCVRAKAFRQEGWCISALGDGWRGRTGWDGAREGTGVGGRGGWGPCREVTCFPGMGVVYAEAQDEMCTDGQHQIAVHATWWADGAAGHARGQPAERTGKDVAGEGTARQGQGGWTDTRGAVLGSEHPRQLWEERKRGWGWDGG